eukprot:SAG11_NODE_10122_length_853_cov_1.307692_1_plen_172_part_10
MVQNAKGGGKSGGSAQGPPPTPRQKAAAAATAKPAADSSNGAHRDADGERKVTAMEKMMEEKKESRAQTALEQATAMREEVQKLRRQKVRRAVSKIRVVKMFGNLADLTAHAHADMDESRAARPRGAAPKPLLQKGEMARRMELKKQQQAKDVTAEKGAGLVAAAGKGKSKG